MCEIECPSLNRMLTSMRPLVALKLVWAGESFAAEGPAADEGSLSRVPSQVSPQVGRLAVDLPTARDVTDVLLLFIRVPAWCIKNKTITRVRGFLIFTDNNQISFKCVFLKFPMKNRDWTKSVTYRPSPSLQKGQVQASLRLRLPWGWGLKSSSSIAVPSSKLSPPPCNAWSTGVMKYKY